MAPQLRAKHPDITMSHDKASLFWYVMCEGTISKWRRTHEQKYDMGCKLNDKDLKVICASGSQDVDMGMLVPHAVDMHKVKQENTGVEDLEKSLKDTTHLDSMKQFLVVFVSPTKSFFVLSARRSETDASGNGYKVEYV